MSGTVVVVRDAFFCKRISVTYNVHACLAACIHVIAEREGGVGGEGGRRKKQDCRDIARDVNTIKRHSHQKCANDAFIVQKR